MKRAACQHTLSYNSVASPHEGG